MFRMTSRLWAPRLAAQPLSHREGCSQELGSPSHPASEIGRLHPTSSRLFRAGGFPGPPPWGAHSGDIPFPVWAE